MLDYVKDFRKKNKVSYVENGRVMAKIKVKYPKIENYLNHILKDDYIQQRIKKVHKIKIL